MQKAERGAGGAFGREGGMNQGSVRWESSASAYATSASWEGASARVAVAEFSITSTQESCTLSA